MGGKNMDLFSVQDFILATTDLLTMEFQSLGGVQEVSDATLSDSESAWVTSNLSFYETNP